MEEDFDPNECGILNHKIVCVLAILVKAFPLWFFIQEIYSGDSLRNLYTFLTENSCSDKFTNNKISATLESINLIHNRIWNGSLIMMLLCALELYPILYSLEVPVEVIDDQNKCAASYHDAENTHTGYESVTHRGELTLGTNTFGNGTDLRVDKDISTTFSRI